MKSKHAYFEAAMVHDDETIRLMFKTEYYTYEKTRLLARYVLAIALVAAALLGGMPTIPQALCLMIGAWLFITPDFPSKVRAEGVIQQRGGQTSGVQMTFDEKKIGIGNGLTIAYDEIDRLIEDERYYYIFRDRQTAVMVPKGSVSGGSEEDFCDHIEQKTGKQFAADKSILTMNLKDILNMLRSEMAQRKARRRE